MADVPIPKVVRVSRFLFRKLRPFSLSKRATVAKNRRASIQIRRLAPLKMSYWRSRWLMVQARIFQEPASIGLSVSSLEWRRLGLMFVAEQASYSFQRLRDALRNLDAK